MKVSIMTLIGMRLRQWRRSALLPMIKAHKADIPVTIDKLCPHLAGGNVDRVVDALIAAHRAEIDLSFNGQRPSIQPAGMSWKQCRV